MIIYISGPMTGHPDHNRLAFVRAALRLLAAGHEVINPAVISAELQAANPAATWLDYMVADLSAMGRAQAIHLLPHWHTSHGARIEMAVAAKMDLPIVDLDGREICRGRIPTVSTMRVAETSDRSLPVIHQVVTLDGGAWLTVDPHDTPRPLVPGDVVAVQLPMILGLCPTD